jgi:phage major head subunit gpT-like protein
MIINRANIQQLFQAYNAAFKAGLDAAPSEQAKLATEIPSVTGANLYAFLGKLPRLREWIGERIIKSLATHDYTLKNRKFESTIGVGVDEIEDDTYGVYGKIFEEMGFSVKTHPDEVIFETLLLGVSALCYDDQPFFDSDHPIKGGTASNYDSSGSNALWFLMDTRRPLKPLIWQVRKNHQFRSFTSAQDEHVFKHDEFLFGVDGRMNAGFGMWQLAYASKNTLDATNFAAYIQDMMELTSDEGHKLNIRPNLLVCGPENMVAAEALINAQTLANGASNPNYKKVELLVTPYLP